MTIQEVTLYLAVFLMVDSALDAAILVYLVWKLSPSAAQDTWERSQ